MDIKKVYQMFILGTDNPDDAIRNGLGGLIFFTKDIITAEQFKSLINKYKSNAIIPMFFSIDQEGGRVERTENIHERYLSPMFAYRRGKDFLYKQTIKIAQELNYYGINMNYAPCLDVNTNPNNPIIGERAFSNIPEEVIDGYNIVSKVYSLSGIIPVVKHFPGHGDTIKDSHLELPHIDIPIENMEETHILPFRHAIKTGIDIIMVGHLYCKCFDKEEIPASLSKNCINYLREKLGFSGVIISDDMIMNGVQKYGMTEACIMGINAGLNMFIYRYSNDEIYNLIDEVIKMAEKDIDIREKINISYKKITNLKKKYNIIK